MKSRRVWRSSEGIASWLLEDLGFSIIEHNKRIILEGLEVGEVDIVAEKDGVLYAVEVKAGRADVGSVKQAYVNASLLKAKPLIIARGADERALAVAEKLGVEVILLPDLLVGGVDEIRAIVREAVVEAILGIARLFVECRELGPEDEELLQAIASNETLGEAAKTLGIDIRTAARRLALLKDRGIPIDTSMPYRYLRLQALALVVCLRLLRRNKPLDQ
ncbi:MAG: YraN family protein [Desulfurococcales archaeon]|nr:YraN family protein [Desulfurococcales archaeon]